MTTKLMESKVLSEVSQAVEGHDRRAIDELIRSLSLPIDEEKSVLATMETLPDTAQKPSALPWTAPSITMSHWWS